VRQLNVAPLVEDVVEHGPHTDLLRRLKSTDSPVILWNAIKNSPPHNCTADTAAAHTLFCTSVIDLLGMVGHTAGVERIGKAYPLFHTKLRASLDSNTLNKLVFVYINMWLERPASENLSRVSFNDFALGLLDEEQAVQLATDLPALNAMPVRAVRPGDRASAAPDSSSAHSSDSEDSSLLSEDEPAAADDDAGDEGNSGGGGPSGSADTTGSAAASLATIVPDGYAPVLQPPAEIKPDLLRQAIMAKVRVRGGRNGNHLLWRFGKLTRAFDPKTNPRYGALYNFDVTFADQTGAVGMRLEINGPHTFYSTGDPSAAEEGSWFLVSQVEG